MINTLKQSFLAGVFFGLCVLAVLGGYLLVQAQIEPGKITNPTFRPQDDDVIYANPMNLGKVCLRRVSSYCSDYILVPDDWTRQDCDDWGNHIESVAYSFKIGCVFPNGTYSFTAFNPGHGVAPTPNCGW